MTVLQLTTFASLAHAQHGVLSRAQLRELGVDDHAVANRLRRRRWQRVLHGVYVVHTGPLRRDAVLEAALLYAGWSACLSHDSAAQLLRIRPRDDDAPVHVTVPYARSATPQPETWGPFGRTHPGVVVHRSRAFAHIVVEADPPRTSAVDTVLDLAVAEPTPRDAARVLVAASSAGRVPVALLRHQLERRRPRRYRTLLLQTLDLVADGVQSALEHRYAVDVEAAHGLPRARRQAPVVVDGVTLHEDVTYEPGGLVVRLDGRRYHSAPTVAFRDRRRDNAAELTDRARLVYGWDEVATDACAVAAEVATVLVREGWTSRSTPCGSDGCERDLASWAQ